MHFKSLHFHFIVCVYISPNSLDLAAYYVKVVEETDTFYD